MNQHGVVGAEFTTAPATNAALLIDGQVYITAGTADVGDIVNLRITDSSDYDLIGEIVE